MIRILVIDDEDVIRTGFEAALEGHRDRYELVGAPSGEEGLERLNEGRFDMAFVDLRMPGIQGLEVLEAGKRAHPDTDFVVITGYSTVESAVQAMKLGAVDYLLKPFTQDDLLGMVRKVERIRNARIRRDEESSGFQRWTVAIRAQHIILMTTFTLLTLTGIPLLFPETFKGIFFFSDSSMLRGLMHRVAAVGLMLLSAFHLGFIVFSADGQRNLRAILPRPLHDLKEAWALLLYTLGLRAQPPRADRYDCFEKLEYFGVVWGTFIMVLTGLMLWFADELFRVFPLWVIDVAKVVHRYEAILAIATIAIWHTYHVHWKPGVFPMSRVWLTGRLTREQMIHHHPLEYERLTGRPAVLHEEGADREVGA
jgi:CheY-like chemotaxis protein/cytochrome b subunit of formate dehydrogenase